MHVIAAVAIGFALFSGFFSAEERPKEEFDITIGIPGEEVRVRREIEPLSAIKDHYVVKQMFDYSCGSAALATLLNFYLKEKYTERQVINGLLQHGDKKLIQERQAFSLLDMKKFVNVLGYEGAGYKAEMGDLKALDKPSIVSIKLRKYLHFVVVKGFYKDRIFVADPSQGVLSFPVSKFKDMWYKNVVFIVSPKGEGGMNALKLREEDLRIIDEETARRFMFQYTPPYNIPFVKALQDERGEYHFFKSR